MRQAVVCLYLYLGLIGSISLFSSEMQKKKKKKKKKDALSHNSRFIQPDFLWKYISVTIKYTIVSLSNWGYVPYLQKYKEEG